MPCRSCVAGLNGVAEEVLDTLLELGPRQLGRQLGRDGPVRNREHGTQDPGAERAAA